MDYFIPSSLLNVLSWSKEGSISNVSFVCELAVDYNPSSVSEYIDVAAVSGRHVSSHRKYLSSGKRRSHVRDSALLTVLPLKTDQ